MPDFEHEDSHRKDEAEALEDLVYNDEQPAPFWEKEVFLSFRKLEPHVRQLSPDYSGSDSFGGTFKEQILAPVNINQNKTQAEEQEQDLTFKD